MELCKKKRRIQFTDSFIHIKYEILHHLCRFQVDRLSHPGDPAIYENRYIGKSQIEVHFDFLTLWFSFLKCTHLKIQDKRVYKAAFH